VLSGFPTRLPLSYAYQDRIYGCCLWRQGEDCQVIIEANRDSSQAWRHRQQHQCWLSVPVCNFWSYLSSLLMESEVFLCPNFILNMDDIC
jgi:hypothetical protein